MPQQHNHIKPVVDPELLRRYLSGELDDKAMHALERQALDDPFLAEALEGLEGHAPDQRVHLADLSNRLEQRVQQRQRRIIPMYLRWAAAAIVLIFAGIGVLWMWRSPVPQDIAKAEPHSDTLSPAEIPAPTPVAGNIQTEHASDHPGFKTPTPPPAPVPATAPTTPPAEVVSADKAADDSRMADAEQAFAPRAAKPMIPADSETEGSLAATFRLEKKRAAVPQGNMNVSRVAPDTRMIKGQVVDAENNSELPGVTISVGTYGTSTDANGNFSIPVDKIAEKQQLNVAYVGYEGRKISVGEKDDNLNIRLKQSSSALSEVVVAGYGTNTKAKVDNSPHPQNGFEQYNTYITQHTRYPATGDKIKGRVRVSFLVQPDGHLTDFEVIRKLREDFDAEAIRVIKEGPQWVPAADGKAARVRVDVRFKP